MKPSCGCYFFRYSHAMNGMQFIKLTNPPTVIFTTAYSEYAVEGFEVNAIDYLVKPIRTICICSK